MDGFSDSLREPIVRIYVLYVCVMGLASRPMAGSLPCLDD